MEGLGVQEKCGSAGVASARRRLCDEFRESPSGPSANVLVLPGLKLELQGLRAPELGEVLADHNQHTLYRYEEDGTYPPKSNYVEPAPCALL